jgi:hypothetical protein
VNSERAARVNERLEDTSRGDSLASTEAGHAYEPTSFELMLAQAEARARQALRDLQSLRHAARGALTDSERADLRAGAAVAASYLALAAASALRASNLGADRKRLTGSNETGSA